MTPSIGRIVHLVDGSMKCRAAIITEVDPPSPPIGNDAGFYIDQVALTVFPGCVDVSPVGYDESKHERTWHWPERVEG